MNPTAASTPPGPHAPDGDLADQARPGHGIPSQDPDPGAQRALEPSDAAREAGSVLMGGSAVAGMATGAALGVAMAGPVGVVVGATMGAVAGTLGAAAVGAATSPSAADVAAISTAARVRLHIEDSGGPGRAVVLIHGWPLSAESWAPQVPALTAAGYRVVAYDRRGFGRSDKLATDYSYDTLADDLEGVMDGLGLQDVTLVGFSMGGGELARHVARHGQARLRSVVFAAAVTPCLMRAADNPDGPLSPEAAAEKHRALEQDREAYFRRFISTFYSAHEVPQVSEDQRAQALAQCHQSEPAAALACMTSFGTTDFRDDLTTLTVPTLVIHGSADAIVPIEGSGLRTHRAVAHSTLVQVEGAPHGLNLSHAQAFNAALLRFLDA